MEVSCRRERLVCALLLVPSLCSSSIYLALFRSLLISLSPWLFSVSLSCSSLSHLPSHSASLLTCSATYLCLSIVHFISRFLSRFQAPHVARSRFRYFLLCVNSAASVTLFILLLSPLYSLSIGFGDVSYSFVIHERLSRDYLNASYSFFDAFEYVSLNFVCEEWTSSAG